MSDLPCVDSPCVDSPCVSFPCVNFPCVSFPCVNVSCFDEGELRSLLRSVRLAQRRLDGLVVAIGTRADALAAEGRSAPASEVLLGDGPVRGATARREAARMQAVSAIPGLADAMAAGRVGVDHVDSILRQTKSLTEDERNALDHSHVLAEASRLPADTFDSALKGAIEQVSPDARLRDHRAKRTASGFRHWFDHRSGMGHFSGQLDPERYEAFTTAIEQHATSLASRSDEETPRSASLAAQALVELVCSSGERRWHLPHLVVVTDHETLRSGWHNASIAQTSNGHDLPPESISRLACEATIRRVTVGDDKPLGTGRRYRTATEAQWDAIRTLHSSCAWPGCDRPLSWCQMHHILEWERGGQGDIDNLVPLCNQHHHAVHEGNWTIALRSQRQLDIWRPDGRFQTSSDPPTRKPPIRPIPPDSPLPPPTDTRHSATSVV